MDHVGAERAGLAEHLEEGGEGELEVGVAGHFHCREGLEVVEVGGFGAVEVGGGEDVEVAVGGEGLCRGVADETGDTVDVGEGVGEEEEAHGAKRSGKAVRGVARKVGVARRRGGGLKIASKAGRHAAEIRAALGAPAMRRCRPRVALEDSLHPGFLLATRCGGCGGWARSGGGH